ncbi:NAD-dependent epimerase/dehydratase family protein [Microvirga brassicacearum]|uniref:NAD-dependent epimerase/dehydratase family protein n=1 Tax=Microvirga brassicacearum TaxID=2580413 RepID=A0A5N3P8B3_9HYPH|nr:NAD-dependent epimerase/dehydratase family protein [Microvirga brassicacearum]KAB0265925.1 NAD-dependent epimerase/dehydratase family protein [Microvirga brassicacearum]
MRQDDQLAAPATLRCHPILITGGAGFIGSNLADRFAQEGHEILIFDALARPGVTRNLDWLKKRYPSKVSSVIADVRDETALVDAVRDVQAVFHMAAQVAVTTSLVDPREDFEINLHGTLNLLDALRRRDDPAPLVFASTNKVYGDLADIELEKKNDAYIPCDFAVRETGISEQRPLDFHTPYGCSKGAADQYVLDYARSFGIATCVLRMSCIYGQRQMGTEDQGWVAHFLIRALEGKPITIYGDGCQVRDVLDVADAVDAYAQAWKNIDLVRGRAFNLGGGPSNAISLKQLLKHIEVVIGHPVETVYSGWRAGDQRYYVSDTRCATRELGLRAPTPWQTGVTALAHWLQEEARGLSQSELSGAPLHAAEAM